MSTSTLPISTSDAHSTQLVKSLREQRDSLRSLLKLKSDSNSNSNSNSTSSNRRSNNSMDQLSEEIDFSRKRLRNTYVRLLFESTFTGSARGQENNLWTETTHPIVESHRKVLASLEKAYQLGLSNKASDVKDKDNGNGKGKDNVRPTAPKKDNLRELRKSHEKETEAYRKFLSSEDQFWQQLASRIVSTFGLNEAKSCLLEAGIGLDPDSSNVTDLSLANVSTTGIGGGEGEEMDMSLSGMTTGLARASGEGRPNGIGNNAGLERELLRTSKLPASRERLVEIVHKCLICCGDLARYRELSKRGSKSILASTSKDSNPNPNPNPINATEPEFKKASEYYEAARRLIPTNGNPSNQLGVISKQLRDPFGAIYHHYRALCVPIPFETAKGNLEVILREGIKWLERGGEKLIREGSAGPNLLMEELVAFHGLVFMKARFGLVPLLSSSILQSFSSCIKSRTLPADLIVRIVVTGLAASWTTRLWRSSPPSKVARSRGATPSGANLNQDEVSSRDRAAGGEREATLARSIELQILSHVLNLFATLADAGASEVREALDAAGGAPVTSGLDPSEQATVLARNITAVFRRTLPALRIASKWMKSHLDYIARSRSRGVTQSQASSFTQSQGDSLPSSILSDGEKESLEEQSNADRKAAEDITLFFSSYVKFINLLRFAFPFESLPTLNVEGSSLGVNVTPNLSLEEDMDMRGFAPTKKAMLQSFNTNPSSTSSSTPGVGQVHPNEEQLMRIKDLMIDAKVVAESDASDIYFDDDNNTFVCPQGDASISQPQSQLPDSSPVQTPLRQTVPSSLRFQGAPLLQPSSSAPENSPSLQQAVAAAIRNAEPSSPSDARSEVDPSESEGRSESTEDVVDLAMRAVGQHQHQREERGFSSEDEDDDQMNMDGTKDQEIDDEDDDERILIPSASLGSLQIQSPNGNSPNFRERDSSVGMGRSPSNTTASDLLLQVLNGQNNTPERSSNGTSQGNSNSTPPPGAQLLFGGNIWSPVNGDQVQQVQNRGWGSNGGNGGMSIHPGMNGFGTSQSQHQSQSQLPLQGLQHSDMETMNMSMNPSMHGNPMSPPPSAHVDPRLNSQGWDQNGISQPIQQNLNHFTGNSNVHPNQFQQQQHQQNYQQQHSNHYG